MENVRTQYLLFGLPQMKLFGSKKRDENCDVHFSSSKDNWETPSDLFRDLNREFSFTIDGCADSENAKCEKFYSKAENGLIQDWGNENVFINPPYSEISKWLKKAYFASKKGATVVCLIPSRTDTRWWHNYVMKSSEVRFVKGRIKFNGAKHGAPFPSAIVVFKPDSENPDR